MIRIDIDPHPPLDRLNALFRDAWAGDPPKYSRTVLARSLVHLGAFEGRELVGFANVAWDGGVHGFLLDVTVASPLRRRGIGARLVTSAVAAARARGAQWLHVDFEAENEAFYRQCGFEPTAAGLLRL